MEKRRSYRPQLFTTVSMVQNGRVLVDWLEMAKAERSEAEL